MSSSPESLSFPNHDHQSDPPPPADSPLLPPPTMEDHSSFASGMPPGGGIVSSSSSAAATETGGNGGNSPVRSNAYGEGGRESETERMRKESGSGTGSGSGETAVVQEEEKEKDEGVIQTTGTTTQPSLSPPSAQPVVPSTSQITPPTQTGAVFTSFAQGATDTTNDRVHAAVGRRRLYFPFVRYPHPDKAAVNNPKTLRNAELLPPLKMKVPKGRREYFQNQKAGGGLPSNISSTSIYSTTPASNNHWYLNPFNVLSLMTFSWIEPLMRLGYMRPLEVTDLWKLADDGDRDKALTGEKADGFEPPVTPNVRPGLLKGFRSRSRSTVGAPPPGFSDGATGARTAGDIYSSSAAGPNDPSISKLSGLDAVNPSTFSYWGPNAPPVPPELEFDAGRLGEGIVYHWERRKREAREWNEKLERGETTGWERGRERVIGWFVPWRRMKFDDKKKEINGKGKAVGESVAGEEDGTGFRHPLMRKPTLVMAVNDVIFWRFWRSGVYKVVADTLQVTSPLVAKEIIKFGSSSYYAHKLGQETPGIGKGIGLAIALFIMQLVASFCMHHFFYISMSTGVLVRGALISAVYRRALLLSSKARVTITNGRLVNDLGTSISRIDFCAGFFHASWSSVIQLIVVIIILLVQLGPSCLAGIGFLFLMIPPQGWAMKRMLNFRRKAMVWTDKRAKLIQELIGGMRVIKFFAWEGPYLEKIRQLRATELANIRNLLVIRAANASISLSLPLMASVLAFVTYTLTGHSQNAAIIFTSLSLFNMLRMPLMMFPQALSTTTDAKNAFDRLCEIFDAPLMDKPFEIDPAAKYAVEVKEGCFQWEATTAESKPVATGPPTSAGAADAKRNKKEKRKSFKRLSQAVHGNKWIRRAKDRKIVEQGSIHDISGEEQLEREKAAAEWEEQEQERLKDELLEREQDDGTGSVRTPSDHPMPEPPLSRDGDAGLNAQASEDSDVVDDVDEKIGGGIVQEGTKEKTLETHEGPSELRDIDLRIPKGQLVAIVGPVGSGKSSLLNALIGEMRRKDGTVTFSGRVGYCPQQAWIQNATLKDNILFGQPWDEEKYNKAVKDACLEADLDMLPARDMTEIGEKGITLSGGQKQRVNIARALYYNADIVCLDDPLSAVDAHVGSYLFSHAIQSAMAGKTRLLVTHALHFLPQADYILCMERGRISERGTYNDLMARDGAFAQLINDFAGSHQQEEEEENKNEEDENEEEVKKEKKVAAKKGAALMQSEERNLGSVSGGVYSQFIVAAKGWVMVPAIALSLALAQGATVLSNYWLVYWQEDEFHERSGFYMGIYAFLGVSQMFFSFTMGCAGVILGYNGSKALHNQAIAKIMRAPMSFFDTTPLGRIMNRFSKDMDTVDNNLNDAFRMTLATFGGVLGAVVLIAIVLPYFLIVVVFVAFGYYLAAKYYRSSARELKRLDNVLRSSLYAHFSESLSGLATIRAYGESRRFVSLNDYYMNTENRAYYLTVVNQRWLGMRLDWFGCILTLAVALLAVGSRYTANPSQIGLVLTYIMSVQQAFSWLVRQAAEVENDMNSTERIIYYARHLEQEAPPHNPDNTPDPSWPSEGKVEFSKTVMSYRPGLPPVLKGISFTTQGGEKVGIVGRTGAGKSSIMMTLFRIVELTSGSIIVDGLDISKLGLEDLRKKIAIIPQDALLFNGTLRSNLDPFGQYDDAHLWDALKRAWLVDTPPLLTTSRGDPKKSVAGRRRPTSAGTGYTLDDDEKDSPEVEMGEDRDDVYKNEEEENEEIEIDEKDEKHVHTAEHRAVTPVVQQQQQGQSRFSLDMRIDDEGGNLSVGERSLVSLARALVKDSKIIVLDEATASVDFATDYRIQTTIRTEFKDKTLLCIAHRLKTIIGYDRILVMDAGQIAEYDKPERLFEMEGGIFRGMCDGSSITKDDIRNARLEAKDN